MLKLPKVFCTLGYLLKVRREKCNSSHFSLGDSELVVSKDAKTSFEVVQDYLHEAIEASLANFGYRYKNWKGELLFVFTHDQFHDMIGEVSRTVLDLIETNKGGELGRRAPKGPSGQDPDVGAIPTASTKNMPT